MDSTTQLAPKQWEILDTIGPVFSNGGLKNWDICLAQDAIICFPRSIWLTFVAGMFAALRKPGAMQRSWAKSDDAHGQRFLVDEGSPKWRRYPVSEISYISFKKCLMSANEFRIYLKGNERKPDIYGLGDRSQTDEGRKLLQTIYPDLYKEE